MKKFIAAASSILVIVFPLIVSAASWKIDPEHSNLGFKVRHLMVSNVKGSFEKFTGAVDLDEKDITRSKVAVSIETNSINTSVVKRDTHLRSADFFDVAKYPVMTFTSKKIVRAGEGKLKVTGDLTLHGVTKEVVLDVEGPTAESKDPWGNIRSGASATTKINRKEFGVNWNKALETGGVLIGDEVQISLEVEMVKAQPK